MSDFGIDPNTAPAGGETPAPAPVATPQVPSHVAATPATPAAAPIAAPEDRSNWVPPHRIRETREAAIREAQRQSQQEALQYQAQLQNYQNQIRALTGIQAPPNPEHGDIKQHFDEVFGAGSSDFLSKREQVEAMMEEIQELRQAVDFVWKGHARSSLDRVYSQAAESLGAPLSDEGKRALHAAFNGWIQASPEYGQRYLDDPTIVDEFWKTLSSTLVDPARRTANAQIASRVPGALPQDNPAGVPTPGPAPKPANMDERVNQMWAGYNANKKL